MYQFIEQTKPHLTDSFLYCSLFIAPTCVSANTSSSGSFHLVPAKIHKRCMQSWCCFS